MYQIILSTTILFVLTGSVVITALFKMNENGVYYDASGYILFESSGDSESRWEMEQDDQADAEDDAQSAISRGSEVVLSDHSDDLDVHDQSTTDDDHHQCPMSYNVDEDEDRNEDEDEEGVVDQCRGTADQRRKKNKKGGFEEEPDVKAMSESERDKLFWDACLASS